jgi:hypothetical protein
LQSPLDNKDTTHQWLRSYIDSLQTATLLIQQQSSPIITTNSSSTVSPQEPTLAAPNITDTNAAPNHATIGFTPSVPSTNATAEGQPQHNSNDGDQTHLASLSPRHESERRASGLELGRGEGHAADLSLSHSMPALLPHHTVAANNTLARALYDSQSSADSEAEFSSSQPASGVVSPPSEGVGDVRSANISAVVSIPVTKIKGR